VVTWGLAHRTLEPIRAVGVDEIAYAKGHKYLTLVYQIDQGMTRLLWVGKERAIDSFEGFFTMIGADLACQIQFVCSDMRKPYLHVIRERCAKALHILDRFHIVAKLNEAVDDFRAAEACRMSQAGHAPLLKKTRWFQLKHRDNLSTEQRFRLFDLLAYNLRTVRAAQRGFSAVSGIRFTRLGRQVPRLLVPRGHAFAPGADEEGRQDAPLQS